MMRLLAALLLSLFALPALAGDVVLEESKPLAVAPARPMSDWTPVLAEARAIVEDYQLTKAPARCLHVSSGTESERYYEIGVWSGPMAECRSDEAKSPASFHLRMDKKSRAFASDASGSYKPVAGLKRRTGAPKLHAGKTR